MTTLRRRDGLSRNGKVSAIPVQKPGRPLSHRRHTRKYLARPTSASVVLRKLLDANADVETLTIHNIMASIEGRGTAAALMLFSIPSFTPVPGMNAMVGTPTIAISGSLIAGRPGVRLPSKLLAQSIPRRSLALAINAVLPVLERVEKLTKERWSWLCTPAAHRVIGVLVFLLALPLTFPVLGFGLPHAASLFTIALGMIERDGLLVALGVVAGIASVVFVTGRQLSPDALAKKLGAVVKTFVDRMALARKAAVTVLKHIWRWLSLKLLTAPSRVKRPVGDRQAAGVPSAVAAIRDRRNVIPQPAVLQRVELVGRLPLAS